MFKILFNKLKLAFLFLFVMVFSCGCVNVEQAIKVDKMGNYEHILGIYMPKELAQIVSREDEDAKTEIGNVIRDELGFGAITPVDEDGIVGAYGTEKGSIFKVDFSKFNTTTISIQDFSKDYFIFKKFQIVGYFNPSADGSIKDEYPISEYAFRIFLPVKSENNAKIVNGDELTWFFDINKENKVEISFVLFNIVNSIILASVLIFLPLVIYLISRLKNSKFKKCPYCGEKIKKEAKKCKHCKNWLDEELEKEYNAKIGEENKEENKDNQENKE